MTTRQSELFGQPHGGDPAAPVSLASKMLRLLAIVVLFGMAGPPVGGLVAWTMMGAATLRSPVPFFTGSYGEALSLALAAGLLIGVAMLWTVWRHWSLPVAAALSVDVIFLAASALKDPSRADLAQGLMQEAWVFVPPSLVAALACLRLARPLTRER